MEFGPKKAPASVSDPVPSGLTILIDSREQDPYRFTAPTVTTGLRSGDYSIIGLQDKIAIERKSLQDAYQTFSHGRARFERELVRLSKLDYAAVVIEADLDKALFYPPTGMSGKSFNRSWIAWAQRYGVHFVFANTRLHAQRITEIMLERFWEDLNVHS